MTKMSYCRIEAMRYFRMLRHNPRALAQKMLRQDGGSGLLDYEKGGYASKTLINEYQISNSYYGMSNQLKKFGGYSGLVAASIEHGLYFGGANTWETSRYNLPCVITFGSERRTALRKVTTRPVFTIGPYIYYTASWIGRDEYKKLKELLGRTLLVFPCHTVESTTVEYEVAKFINFIDEAKKAGGFDSVLVSLYFTDIARFAHQYEQAGYIVVCSGHRSDPSFMDRQRLYFDLAESTVSNSVGTHVGYSIALNKPHCIFEQKIDATNERTSPFLHIDNDAKRAAEEKQEIARLFSCFSNTIEKEQYDIINRYWGLSEVKGNKEIGFILDTAKTVLRDSFSSKDNYRTLFLHRAELSGNEEFLTLVKDALR